MRSAPPVPPSDANERRDVLLLGLARRSVLCSAPERGLRIRQPGKCNDTSGRADVKGELNARMAFSAFAEARHHQLGDGSFATPLPYFSAALISLRDRRAMKISAGPK